MEKEKYIYKCQDEFKELGYEYFIPVSLTKEVSAKLYITAEEYEQLKKLVQSFAEISDIFPVRGMLTGEKEAIEFVKALCRSHDEELSESEKAPCLSNDSRDDEKIVGTFFVQLPEREGEEWELWDYLP